MAKQQEKRQALLLRRDGKSINFIAEKLGVSKSTVSGWCKDIELTTQQIESIARLSKHHATTSLLQAAEEQRRNRIVNTENHRTFGEQKVGSISDRDVLMVGLGLYWGEGYKKGSQELGFTNSDPAMILFYLRWLGICYNITPGRLILRVSINNIHTHREKEILGYWSKLVKIPLTQFTKTSFIKTQTKKQHYIGKHYGTLRVKVRRGTMLRHEILGAIAQLTKPPVQKKLVGSD